MLCVGKKTEHIRTNTNCMKNILNKVEGIDVHNLPSGMYLYVINEGFKNQIITGKLIIAKN